MADDIILDDNKDAGEETTEIQAPGTASGDQPKTFDPQAYQMVLDSIRHKTAMIEETTKELTSSRESLASVLENDETYQTHLKAVKEATKLRNKTKQELLKLASNAILVEKIKDLNATLKDLRESLSEDLVQYVNVAGVNEFEDEDGTPREIVFVARLKARGQRE